MKQRNLEKIISKLGCLNLHALKINKQYSEMTTTASEVYTDLVLLYKLKTFQPQPFFLKTYDHFEKKYFDSFLLGFCIKVTALALCKSIGSAIQLFGIHHRITFATIQNPAVHLSVARVSIFFYLVSPNISPLSDILSQ